MPRHFCVAGVALGDMDFPFAWQEGLATSTFALRGMRGAFGTGLGLVATSLCFLTGRRDIDLRFGSGLGGVARLGPLGRPGRRGTFAWQAWRLATSTFVLRGRGGAWRHRPSFCVAGVALMMLGWVVWRAWVRLLARDAAALLRGGRGAWRHPSFLRATPGDIDLF